MSKNKPLNQSR